jgi:hypothetical protein
LGQCGPFASRCVRCRAELCRAYALTRPAPAFSIGVRRAI